MWRCWFFHKWGNWEIKQLFHSVVKNKEVYADFNQRRCERCDLLQRRGTQ